jgi:hypothetical protein
VIYDADFQKKSQERWQKTRKAIVIQRDAALPRLERLRRAKRHNGVRRVRDA